MGYAIRTVVCEDCGKTMTGRYKPKPPWRCFECGLANMVRGLERQHAKEGPEHEANVRRGKEIRRQVKARKGPYYDKWRAGMLVAAGGDPLLPKEPESDTD